jgi:hypothetical protein
MNLESSECLSSAEVGQHIQDKLTEYKLVDGSDDHIFTTDIVIAMKIC